MSNKSTRQMIILATLVGVAGLGLGCSATDEGRTVVLFDGDNLDGWNCMGAPDQCAWQTASKVEPDPATADEEHQLFNITPGTGILVNSREGKTRNIYTDLTHGDCKAHIEFMVPKGSNSGVYFMGKYEIQILDSYGKDEVTFSDCGGIYARWIDNQNVDGHAPRVNASKAPGEWQVFEVNFRAPRFDEMGNKTENARFLKVIHNGKVVHENVELKGPTRAAMPGPEQARGPIMLQGDHGPVAYRNLRITLLD
jgi:hypothetical protein